MLPRPHQHFVHESSPMPQPTYQDALDPAELAHLEALWGPLPVITQTLDVDHPFLTGENQLLTTDPRRAEICYIMHRGCVADGVLLHIKRFYPPSGYRLPTGGIHRGESVADTLAREIPEETGMRVGTGADEVQVQRYLGALVYALRHHSTQTVHHFATYHFLVRMPANGSLQPQDADEAIAGWQWRPPAELGSVAKTLAAVGAQYPVWADWGRFRALSHRFVADALA